MAPLESLISFYRRQSQASIFLQALALVGAVGFIDYITGYEVTIFPFYAIPILLALWCGNKRSAIAISIFSALAWLGADVASGHRYSREWLVLWDTAVRWMFFGLVIFAGMAIRQQRDAQRARVELLERMHHLEKEITDISESERQRIGRDLHDGVCQQLVAIAFTAGLLKKELEGDSPRHAGTAKDIADRLQDAMIETRDLARGLSPVDRDARGLESALNDLASTTSRLMGISCVFHCAEPVQIKDNAVSVHLFRIAQEALSNATKHGHAQSIAIELEGSEDRLSLRVTDDGAGFHPKPGGQSGIGLKIMDYRARTVGGKLSIGGNAPRGTVVSCTIDHPAKAAQIPEAIVYE
jgi:signal transduction histidine kinase